MRIAVGRKRTNVTGTDMPSTDDGRGQEHVESSPRNPFDKPLPPKVSRTTTRYRFGFGRRTIVFVLCVIILGSFMWSSFLSGSDTGEWFASISKDVMNATLIPLTRLAKTSFDGTRAETVFNGLLGLSDIDAVNIVLTVFIVSLVISIIVAIIADIVMSIRLTRDGGSVAMMRGFQQRYDMYQRLR